MQILESFKQLMYAIEGTGVWFFVYPNIVTSLCSKISPYRWSMNVHNIQSMVGYEKNSHGSWQTHTKPEKSQDTIHNIYIYIYAYVSEYAYILYLWSRSAKKSQGFFEEMDLTKEYTHSIWEVGVPVQPPRFSQHNCGLFLPAQWSL